MNHGVYMIGFDGPVGNFDYATVAVFASLICSIMALPVLILPVLHYLRYLFIVK